MTDLRRSLTLLLSHYRRRPETGDRPAGVGWPIAGSGLAGAFAATVLRELACNFQVLQILNHGASLKAGARVDGINRAVHQRTDACTGTILARPMYWHKYRPRSYGIGDVRAHRRCTMCRFDPDQSILFDPKSGGVGGIDLGKGF